MSNVFFSPTGRIGSQEFMKAGVILIVIGTGLSLLTMSYPSTSLLVLFAYLLMIFPWSCIWVKRLHHGNKSGSMIFLFLLLYVILLMVLSVIGVLTLGDGALWEAAKGYAEQEITFEEYLNAIENASTQGIALPSLIGGVIASFLTLVIGDKGTPVDPNDNQYGPA